MCIVILPNHKIEVTDFASGDITEFQTDSCQFFYNHIKTIKSFINELLVTEAFKKSGSTKHSNLSAPGGGGEWAYIVVLQQV